MSEQTTQQQHPTTQRLSAMVETFERETSAELLIATCPQSGHYYASAWATGTVLGMIALMMYIFSPIEYYDDLGVYSVIGSFALGYFLVALLPAMQRLLTRKNTQTYFVDMRAHATFVKEGIHHTKSETGVLVFISLLEQQAVVIADRGVRQAMPAADLAAFKKAVSEIFASGDYLDNLQKVIAQYTPAFAAALPKGDDDTDELKNALHLTSSQRLMQGGLGLRMFKVR